MLEKIAIIVPMYNEEITIKSVIDELDRVLEGASVYVFDNNSTDKSCEIVEALINSREHSSLGNHSNDLEDFGSSQTPSLASLPKSTKNIESTTANIRMLGGEDSSKVEFLDSILDSGVESTLVSKDSTPSSKKHNSLYLYKVSTQGKGAVIREAFAMIDADIYIMIDADTQYDISILPKAIKYFRDNKLDMLNIARDLNTKAYRFGHSFGNKLFSKAVSVFFGKKFNDILSGYRIFSKAFVKSFPAHSNGFEIESELTIFALEQRLRIDEVQASYKARPEGSNSKLSTFRDGFKILFMIFQLLFTQKPLLVFSIFSLIFISLGIIFGIPVVLEYLETSKVPRFPTLIVCIGSEVIGVLLAISGLLAHLISRSAKEARYLGYLRVKSAK